MKRNYLLTMIITVLFMLPVMLVCQVPDIKISDKVGKHTPKGPTDNALLYGQLSSPSDEPAVASQDFTDLPDYSCQAADDFIVPEGETWLIDEIFFSGQYSLDGGPASLAHLFIYLNDTLTNAPGVLVAELIDFPVTASPEGELTFDILQAPGIDPITLEQGHYWISVQPHMPDTPYKQWFWMKQGTGYPDRDYPFHWENPGGGFGLPYPDWTPSTVVFEGTLDHNLAYAIYGEEMGCPLVDAGDDMTICDGQSVTLQGYVENYTSLFWYTPNGSGTFDDSTSPETVYTPSASDYTLGAVDICLVAGGVDPCGNAEDCMTLTIAQPLIISKTVTNVSYFGANDGAIYVEATGGSGYLVTRIYEGSYIQSSVSNRTAQACDDICSACPGICFGLGHFCVCVVISGGPPSEVADPTNLGPGTYTIFVMDTINGCSAVDSAFITETQTVIYKDLVHTSLGLASLTNIDDEILIVDNIGSSGEDGFSVDVSDYPDNSNWNLVTNLAFESFPVGANCILRSKGDVPGIGNQVISEAKYEKVAGGINASVDFTPSGATFVEAAFYKGDTLIYYDIIPNGDFSYWIDTPQGSEERRISFDAGWIYVSVKIPIGIFEFTISLELVKGGTGQTDTTFQADYVQFTALNPISGTNCTKIDVTASNTSSFTIFDEYVIKGSPISIPAGWSIISSYLEPFNSSMEYLFEDVIAGNQLEVMLGKTGIFWPSGSINTIGDWDVYQGYKIKMNEPGSIQFIGEIPEDKSIHLDAGTNYIPVLSQEFYPAMDIFGQLGEGLIFAFDLNTGLLWWPQGGINTLDVLEPGKGYLVGMTQPGQATYSPMKANIQNHKPARPKVYENAPWSVTKSGLTHFVSIKRSALGELAMGDFIGVFNSEGLCAGFTQIDEAAGNILLVAYGNDFTVKASTGLADSENMTFRIFHPATATESSASVSFDASMPNAGIYTENGLSIIVNIKAGATSIVEGNLNKIRIFPNPTKGTFTIEGMHEIINVRIFNAFGGEVYLDELNLPAKVDLSTQPKGIYFISIETDNSTFFKKLVIH